MTTKPAEPAAAGPPLNLHQRMLAAMGDIGYVPKAGTGPQAQGSYPFARVEDIKDAVRAALIARGVMVYTSMDGRDVQMLSGTNSQGQARTSILATVWGSLTFVNVDEPAESIMILIHGQGIDTQDKAVSKATTSAVKYGLLNAFTIPTGDDPDAEGHDVPTQRPAVAPRTAQGGPGSRGGDPGPIPPDEAAPARPTAAGSCPRHGKPWRSGNRGWYCATKVGDGWCDLKPSEAWIAEQER